jgi:hypothetical protein
MRDGTNRKISRITSTHSQTNPNKHEHTHTHNARGRHFPPRHYHHPPAPESKPPTTAGTALAPWRLAVNPRHRYHGFPQHLPAHEMKAFYESAIEPECPRPDYDPAMDEPEPPAPRRKPPFETVKTERGRTHRFEHFTVFTGYCKGIVECKYASIVFALPDGSPVVMCERKDIARLLQFNRKGGVC